MSLKISLALIAGAVLVAGAPAFAKASPGFPKESAADRAAATERQRSILEREFAVELELLAKARRGLEAGDRGDPALRERLEDEVENHQRNIEALRRELSRLEPERRDAILGDATVGSAGERNAAPLRAGTQGAAVPPGHPPPPGACRIWYPDRPPGHQPPAGRCAEMRYRLPPGAVLLGD